MEEVVILSAVRTPIGEFLGCLSGIKAHDLGGAVIKEALHRANIPPEDVSEVIMGQVLTAGQGQNTARQAAVKAEIPYTVPAFGVNMLCGSGLKSIILGYQSVASNNATIVVCGGQENMSQAQHTANLRQGKKLGDHQLHDTLLVDGLTDAFHHIHMGETAENVAQKHNIIREEQDIYAVESQQKTERAVANGNFIKEIVPVIIKSRKGGGDTVISMDEYFKPGTTLNSIKKLKPVFSQDGTITAANASGINDGAAAVVLTSKMEAKKRGLTPMAKIVAFATSGVHPLVMCTGPIDSISRVLEQTGWDKDEVDLYEINEAFAAQMLVIIKEMFLDAGKININGGAIALGHPIGASGTRILVTLLHSLERTGGRKGIAALCIGGGMGVAMAVERL